MFDFKPTHTSSFGFRLTVPTSLILQYASHAEKSSIRPSIECYRLIQARVSVLKMSTYGRRDESINSNNMDNDNNNNA
ncbi:MAG: hypothetical protein M3M91_08490 [Thermoproteota archaeon]|nr:hypothetical protein [Thermoproteota archaeon]